MPRPLRILYPNACYHVMNRGAGKQNIFQNNHHRTIFLDLLHECCKLFNIKIYAYCLMNNHYHILLTTPDANLPRVMRHLNGVYTQKYNRLMKRDGPLFRGRYHAKLVEEDCYRLLLTRYIHLNPVNAGIVENPADYRWSSYRNYVEEKSLEEINDFKSIKFNSPIIGSVSFIEKSLGKIKISHMEPCSTDINSIKIIPPIHFIMENVISFYQIDYDTLIKIKSGTTNLPKLTFMYICNKEFGHTLSNIAKFTKFSRYESVSAAVRKCDRQIKESPGLAEQINLITKNIKMLYSKYHHITQME